MPAFSASARRDLVASFDHPAYAWREIWCSIEPDTPEFGNDNYYQTCGLVQVWLFRVEDSPGGCTPIAWTLPKRFEVDITITWSRATNKADGCLTQIGDVELGDSPSTRLLAGRPPGSLPKGSSWVSVRLNRAVSRTEIGCKFFSLLCEPAFETPVFP